MKPSSSLSTDKAPLTGVQRNRNGAMELADAELAARIIRLNTLAYLRSELALRLEMDEITSRMWGSFPPTEDQVTAFAMTIDF